MTNAEPQITSELDFYDEERERFFTNLCWNDCGSVLPAEENWCWPCTNEAWLDFRG